MHKPLKGAFTDIINAVADGNGIPKPRSRNLPPTKNIVKASEPTFPKKP
jgi:hypothetical protein